ncbi:hypothetical protein [Aeromonas dhakensis]|uniref:hypothetical protein n=1 Tax=Aeromonas dhakensis TaxID=196024 RepID=UPI002B49C34C|nr:hypothetical protein [Aeromonas dhakensis]
MIINVRTLIGYAIAFSVFSAALSINTPIGDFNYYIYPLASIALLIFLIKPRVLGCLSVFFIFSIFQVILKFVLGYPYAPYFKQLVPIVVIYISIYELVKYVGIEKSFNCYLQLSKIIAVLGFFQLFLFITTNSYSISPYGIRISSIITEPSHLAIVLMPALMYNLKRVIDDNKRVYDFLIILMCIILTQSLSVIFPVLIILPLIASWRLVLKIVPFIIVLSVLIINFSENNDALQHRFLAMSNVVSGEYDYNTGQETVYSALTNSEAALFSIKKSFGLGVGLGGHPYSYDTYFEDRPDVYLRDLSFGINKLNGHSLLIRMVSELGVISIAFIVFFLAKSFYRKELINDPIFISCLTYILARFIKLGGYFDHGLPFFMAILIVLYRRERV